MRRIYALVTKMVRRSIERDRSKETHVEAISRLLWPWSETRLMAMCALLALLDYISTYGFLQLSGNRFLFEGGMLAGWALKKGGFPTLFFIDAAALISLLLLAFSSRFLYSKFGFRGFGRGAFVFLLVPYVVITMAVIFNNVALTFSYR
jgi:hypothetical protein